MKSLLLASAVVVLTLGLGESGTAQEAQPPQQPPAQAQDDAQFQSQQAETRQIPRGAREVFGKKVIGTNGQEVGEVHDVIISQGGEVEGVVIERGGVLGVGSKQVAVDWNQLSIDPQAEGLTIDMTEEQVGALPDYEEDTQAITTEPPPAAVEGEQGQ